MISVINHSSVPVFFKQTTAPEFTLHYCFKTVSAGWTVFLNLCIDKDVKKKWAKKYGGCMEFSLLNRLHLYSHLLVWRVRKSDVILDFSQSIFLKWLTDFFFVFVFFPLVWSLSENVLYDQIVGSHSTDSCVCKLSNYLMFNQMDWRRIISQFEKHGLQCFKSLTVHIEINF